MFGDIDLKNEDSGYAKSSAVPLLQIDNIVKEFPGCLANDHISLTIKAGEIHALLGENGSGKSTLVKMIYGVQQPDDGRIIWNGQEIEIDSPSHARQLGIGMVYQHFSLFEPLTVLENILLGLDQAEQRAGLKSRIVKISKDYGLPLNPDQIVYTLSVGEKQRVEIVRCLLQQSKLLIMDEPTSVLTPIEADSLFSILRRLAKEGCAILFISHKLKEVRALCHNATIIRHGKVVARCDPRLESNETLAEYMIGSKVVPAHSQISNIKDDKIILQVSNLSMRPQTSMGVRIRNVSFKVKYGEIFGIAGVAGNGQSELMDLLSGEILSSSPQMIKLHNTPIGNRGTSKRRKLGACFVVEERNGHGAIGSMDLMYNGLLSAAERCCLSDFGFININKSEDFADDIIYGFDVRCGGNKMEARFLSGGNLQKFVVGREILQRPDLLVISQPTWGVDAGSAAQIHQAILDLAHEGCGVVVISQDLDEILTLCDRAAVMNSGKLSKSFTVDDNCLDDIILLMGGVQTHETEVNHSHGT